MRSILLLLAVFGAGQEASAAEIRSYRWFPKTWSPLPHLVTATLEKMVMRKNPEVPAIVGIGDLGGHQNLAKVNGELVEKGVQGLGPASIDGTWMQTIFHPDGRVLYAAGEVFDGVSSSEWLARVSRMQAENQAAQEIAQSLVHEFRQALIKAKPEVRLRRGSNGSFEAYWRFEYLNEAQDQVFFVLLGERGDLLEKGKVSVSGIDGKGLVFPSGPKWSAITEVPLHSLSGDGTLSSRLFRITSALNLDVRSSNLLFFFADTDRRFDLTQVYYTIERSLQWMKDVLGAELKENLEIRLHVGDNGQSNAAFYHRNVIYLGTGDGITYQGLPRDPSVVIHESIHALIDAYSGLPSEGEGGSFNEGFADFFTALILKKPQMGDNSYLKGPYRRTLENDYKAYQDFTDGVYRNGSIIAATFWDLRGILSDERLAQLAFRTLIRLGSGGKFQDFIPALVHASTNFLSPEEQQKVLEKCAARGWAVVP